MVPAVTIPPPSPSGESESGDDLTDVGVKTIAIYQTQVDDTRKVWKTFTHYSAVMLILSIAMALLRDVEAVRINHRWLAVVPLAGYIVFAIANHRWLALTVDELRLVTGAAISRGGKHFKVQEPVVAKRWHILLTAMIIIVYIIMAWWL